MSRVTSSPPASRSSSVPRGDTLPRSAATPPGRRGTALLALLGSLVLLVGVPVGLVLLVGNPLPASVPDRSWLTADLTAGLVIDVLAILVWAVWAHFVVCFLTEWRAFRAGRVPGRVLLGGGSQTVARQLVASILLLSGGASIAHGASALTATAPEAATPTSPAAVQTMEPQVVLAPVAESGADETVKHYEVRPPVGRNHDTLWDIAERTLGDPFRYKEIFALNKDRLQPDGRRLTDADLIQPGWQLRLPADAKGPGVRTTTAPAPLPTRPGDTAVQQSGTTAQQPGTDAAAQEDRGSHQGGAAGQRSTVTGDGQHDSSGLGALLLGGGLVLAGVVRALTARRGPFGQPDEADAELGRAAALRRAELLDSALRGLGESRLAQGLPMPEVLFAYVDDQQVVLHLAASTVAPERPWTASEDGQSWTLHADELVTPGAGSPAPYPSLVAVAESHGFDLLVDLERSPGLVAIGGDAAVAREVTMAMALELVTHAWSDQVTVVMAGFGDELADLSRGSIKHVPHLDAALAEARQGRERLSGVSAELGVEGVLQGRQKGAVRECAPVVVFSSGPPTAEQAQEIAALTSGGRTPVSVVCVGDSPSARWRFVVDAAGSFDGGVLGVRGTARRITGEAQARVRTLLEDAVRRRVEGEFEAASAAPAAAADEVRLALVDRSGGDDPAGPGAAGAPAAVRLQLLGPVSVQAPGHVDPARREQLTELVVMAALHPDGLHEAVLRASLWPRGADPDVVQARLVDAQEWLGRTADGRPRLTFDGDGRWHLAGDVSNDYARLAAAARHAGPGELEVLLGALRLGSGEAFSGPGTRYTWLAFTREARTCRVLACSAARRAADLAVAAGRPEQAEEAFLLGLRLVPTAEALWRDRLRLLAAHAPDRLSPTITEMYSVLRQHGVRHEPETDALVDELVPELGGAVGG